jgi:hypothetical protein
VVDSMSLRSDVSGWGGCGWERKLEELNCVGLSDGGPESRRAIFCQSGRDFSPCDGLASGAGIGWTRTQDLQLRPDEQAIGSGLFDRHGRDACRNEGRVCRDIWASA